MSPNETKRSMRQRFFLRVFVPAILLFSVPWLATGCNDYPLQLLEAKPYLEITDTLSQSKSRAVDILFVVDNSGSMKEEQAKLSANFKTFINELTSKDVGDYQIGIVSTDMDNPLEKGKLQGNPKIISRANMSATQVVSAFQKNINLGIKGTSYEKALDAMRAALDPKLLADPNGNQGFLRPGALLAIIFIGDEDDCSHDGTIAETELDSEVCRLPKSEILKDENGNPIPDAKGQPVKGHLENLTPVKTYIDFLNGLNRKIVVAGMIGNPLVYKGDPKDRRLVDPNGGCKQDIECTNASNPHKCEFNSPSTRKCGGCKSKDADAVPGFRIYDVIKAFGGTDEWFPICGDDKGFSEALLRFAGLIINQLNFVVLTRAPLDPNSLTVRIVFDDGRQPQLVNKAAKFNPPRTCKQDTDCGGTFACGEDDQCYKDGWVYYTGSGQPKLKLSGSAKAAAQPGTKISVTYATQ